MKLIVIAAALLVGVGVLGSSPAAMKNTSSAQTAAASNPDIPKQMMSLYTRIADLYGLDWAILAAIGKVETNHCQSNGVSTAGATGCMQFMPATWAAYGNGKDPNDPEAAIDAAARYLVANGAPKDYDSALFAYNHAGWYVEKVKKQADEYRDSSTVAPSVVATGLREKVVQLAMSTLTEVSGYSYYCSNPCAGAMTEALFPKPGQRSDCSQWIRAVYINAGAPDPGFNTYSQAAYGRPTNNPQPGDLMFSADLGHVELYIGNGYTIGHGTAPIDYAHVSNWPNHFFRSFL